MKKVETDSLSFEELQEKLGDVFDFNSADDCKKVITMLVRDLKVARHRIEKLEHDSKLLAALVLNHKDEMNDQAKEVLNMGKKGEVNIIEFMTTMSQTMEEAEKMDDETLIGEVLNQVWGNFDVSSLESALLGELIGRYNTLKEKK